MRSSLSPGWMALIASVLLVVGLGVFLRWYSAPPDLGPSEEPIVVYCADALRVPLQAIATAYQKETGQRVEFQFNSSQALLAQMEISKRGDLYLPADDSFLDLARGKKLIREILPLATMSAVAIVHTGSSPLTRWSEFLHPSRTIILGNPDATAIGKVMRDALKKTGQWAEIEKRKPVFQAKVSEVATAVQINPRGVGVVWDAVAAQFPKVTTVALPELAGITSRVGVAVTSFSKQPTRALRFARFVAAKDRGLLELNNLHYRVEENGDEWESSPTLNLFGGTMLRPAIEQTIRDFEEREGVQINTNWNGCGILVGEMKTNKIPDIYFACEPRFLEKVGEHFGEPDIVSTNRLVITVRKGNPRGIKTLRDLGQDDLKVGVGNENQCALGDLTKTTFIRTGLYGKVRRNIAKEAPSGDLLISDFRGGALDVIICYESNVTPYLNEFEFHPVDIGEESRDCTNPEQPVAIGRMTAYPQLARRLLEAFQTPESRLRFEKLGFGWKKK